MQLELTYIKPLLPNIKRRGNKRKEEKHEKRTLDLAWLLSILFSMVDCCHNFAGNNWLPI